MPAVTFDPAGFKARYPEFNAVADATLTAFFSNDAVLYLSNTDCPVQDPVRRLALFNMLVAHIAALAGVLNPAPAQGAINTPVGRTSGATEGTVNAQFAYEQGTGDWFNQTQYGAAFWRATLPYRSARYRPRPYIIR